MTNTEAARSLSVSASLAATPMIFELSGNPIAVRKVAADPNGPRRAALRELVALGWADAFDGGPGVGLMVELTGLGLEARSEALVAAADALQDWARRRPI